MKNKKFKKIICFDADNVICHTKEKDYRNAKPNKKSIKKILGFHAIKSVEDAVIELCYTFKKKLFKNTLEDDFYFNVKRLKNLKVT